MIPPTFPTPVKLLYTRAEMAMAIVFTELLIVKTFIRGDTNDDDDDRAMPQRKEETACHG